MKTHGMSNLPEYSVWHGIKDRCLNPNSVNWERYGGRGIQICQRWADSFECFYADMGPRPSDNHSIERQNNNGNYEPNNCHWATDLEQSYNRSTTLAIKLGDQEVKSNEAVAQLGINKKTLYTRLWREVPIDQPVMEQNRQYDYKGRLLTAVELSSIAGVPVTLIRSRISSGMDPVLAAETPVQKAPTYPFRDGNYTVAQICQMMNVKDFNLRYHLRNGKTVEQALNIIQSK